MRIGGTVKNAADKNPIPGVKITLGLEDEELAVLYSDDDGQFEYGGQATHSGKIYHFHAEKEGFKPYDIDRDAGLNDIQLEIDLASSEETALEPPPPVEEISRFVKLKQHPDYPSLMEYVPPVKKGHKVLFGLFATVLSIVTGFGLLLMFLAFLSIRHNVGPFIFGIIMSVIGGGLLIVLIKRWRRLKHGPLTREPAVILDKRTQVSNDYTTYYVTLENETKERRELKIEGLLYGLLAKDDIGVGYIKKDWLLDYRRVEV